jgi:hypothetical protein
MGSRLLARRFSSALLAAAVLATAGCSSSGQAPDAAGDRNSPPTTSSAPTEPSTSAWVMDVDPSSGINFSLRDYHRQLVAGLELP